MTGLQQKKKTHMLFLKTCMLVTWDRIALTLFITKYGLNCINWSEGALLLKSIKQQKYPLYSQTQKLNMLAKTEGGPAGGRSSLISTLGIPIQIAWPSLHPTDRASTPESDHTADHCGPPSVRPPVLVILLVQRGGYLFLHQPQFITQVAVGFQKVLDLGFRGRECSFHLHVFLHSNGAIGEVGV